MDTISIPLSKLRIDPANVRHPKEGDLAAQVHDMQQSLIELGQLSALEVRPLRKPRGHFQVFAGGRRLLAFQGLAADGRIPADHPVRCDVHDVDDARAAEISAAENLIRVSLKATEEFQFFAELIDKGVSEEDVARRFGITVLQVRQRRRLGRLHPTVFEALDAEQVTLDLAQAYASTEDRALQARVFGEMSSWNHTPQNVRNAIRGGAAGVDVDRMLRVVGAEAYLAAGGQFDIDLFSDYSRVVNRGTLEELYYAKVQQQEAALAATLPEQVTVVTSTTGIGAYVYTSPAIPEEQRDRLTAIDARSEEIHDALERLAEWDEADADKPVEDSRLVAGRPDDQARVDALRAELDRLEAESETIHGAAETALPDGPIVALAEPGPGGMTVKGYYRPAGWVDPEREASPARAGGVDPVVATKAETGLSQDGVQVMRSHRRAILRGMMVDQREPYAQDLALGFLVFSAARLALQQVIPGETIDWRREYSDALGITSSFTIGGDPIGGNEVGAQPGATAFQARIDILAKAPWIVEKDLQRAFALFCEDAPFIQVGAVVAGLMLDRTLRAPGLSRVLHDQLALAIGVTDDREIRRRYWTPDAAFFDWLPKGRKIDAVAEVSPRIAKAIAKKPTADIGAACARFFRADPVDVKEFGMIEAEVRYARMWVPSFLRFDQGDPPWVVAHGASRALERVS